ncbi:unnamed protein product [Heligmosomoides polygyrus]|uniref:Secreted protein n=1 Tax=Heligmosomoides polygyrus TaxID=6339 RepID=A0A183FFF3_HELPZ|nr:unnamed protein product [Heligmosomoides polygyrus]
MTFGDKYSNILLGAGTALLTTRRCSGVHGIVLHGRRSLTHKVGLRHGSPPPHTAGPSHPSHRLQPTFFLLGIICLLNTPCQ